MADKIENVEDRTESDLIPIRAEGSGIQTPVEKRSDVQDRRVSDQNLVGMPLHRNQVCVDEVGVCRFQNSE